MPKILRRILFWTFIVLFVVTAPLLVLYTAGFRLGTGGQVVRTGILSVSTIPRASGIEINHKPNRLRTPAVIKNLVPRTYTLTFTREGFHPWEREVAIQSQITTFFESVVLWMRVEPTLLETQSTSIVADPTKKRIASIQTTGAWTEIWIEELEDGDRFLIARFAGTAKDALALSWSPDGTRLLLGSDVEGVFVVHADGSQRASVDDLISAPPEGIWWDEGAPHTLLVATTAQTLTLDPDTHQTDRLLSFPTQTSLRSDGTVYFTRDHAGQTIVVRQTTASEEPLALLPRGTYRFMDSRLPYLLLQETDRNRLYLLDTVVRDQPILLQTEASTHAWSPKRNELLYTNGFEAHIFQAESGRDILLTRVSEKILDVTWHPEGTAVVLAHPSGLVAYDVTHDQGFVTTPLQQVGSAADVFIDDKGRFLYFQGTVDGVFGLYRQAIK